MSTFGCEMRLVKTRKDHYCITCGRTVPKGKMAHHTGGMFEGDWQHWYMCKFCNDNQVWEAGEYVSGDEFREWLRDQDFYSCPNCKGFDSGSEKQHRCNPDWDWSEDQESVLFECDICGYKWSQHIGWGE